MSVFCLDTRLGSQENQLCGLLSKTINGLTRIIEYGCIRALWLEITQKPYTSWTWVPKTVTYESLEPEGKDEKLLPSALVPGVLVVGRPAFPPRVFLAAPAACTASKLEGLMLRLASHEFVEGAHSLKQQHKQHSSPCLTSALGTTLAGQNTANLCRYAMVQNLAA